MSMSRNRLPRSIISSNPKLPASNSRQLLPATTTANCDLLISNDVSKDRLKEEQMGRRAAEE